MAKPNFTTGWTSASIAPSIPTTTPTSPTVSGSGTASIKPAGTVGNATAVNPVMLGGTLGQPGNYLDQLKQAAMGTTGMGGSISASVYQHPDAPAFLADAVRNLNSSQGFSQQNLTNLLLQQILGGVQSFNYNPSIHETQTAAQKAEDARKVADAKAKAAANAHAAEVHTQRLSNNATIAGSTQNRAMSPMGLGGGWTAPAGFGGTPNGGYAPGTVNGVFQ